MLELNRLEKYKENNRIEAKQALGGLPGSIWETYSAFANTLGGVILLGVEENKDKSLHAVDLPDPESLKTELMAKATDPEIISTNLLNEENVRIIEADGKKIIVVEIPQAPMHLCPVYIEGDPVSGAFIRRGEGDYRLTPEEREALFSREESRRDAMKKQMVINYLTDHVTAGLEELASYLRSGRIGTRQYLEQLKNEEIVSEEVSYTEGGKAKRKYRLKS